MSAKHGALFKNAKNELACTDLKTYYIATVNVQLLNQLSGINTKLKSQDQVRIMPVFSVGQTQTAKNLSKYHKLEQF